MTDGFNLASAGRKGLIDCAHRNARRGAKATAGVGNWPASERLTQCLVWMRAYYGPGATTLYPSLTYLVELPSDYSYSSFHTYNGVEASRWDTFIAATYHCWALA